LVDGITVQAEGVAHRERAIDVDAERARTPGAKTRHHFNAAGAALQTSQTVDAVVDHLRAEEAEGGYEAAARNRHLVDAAYTNAALLLGGKPAEIALFDSATTGMRQVLDALRLRAGRQVVVSRSTYVSQALQLLTLASESAIDLVVIPNAADGGMDLDVLESTLAGSADAVVCVAHIPTSSGLVEPVRVIGELTRRHGALYLLDATQSVGQLDVRVRDIGCDVLVTTGRKFLRAPRGTGLAWVSEHLLAHLVPTAPDVRASSWTSESNWTVSPTAQMLESWEHSVASRIGLAVALEQALERGMGPTAAYLQALAADLRAQLAGLDGVEVTDPAASASAIVTFRVTGVPDRIVCDALRDRNIFAISIPAAHAQWDLGSRGVPSVVRASVHVYNNTADIEALVNAVSDIALLHRGVTDSAS